jgi:hypothetical protein
MHACYQFLNEGNDIFVFSLVGPLFLAHMFTSPYQSLVGPSFQHYSNSSSGLQIEASKTYLEAQLENIEVQNKHPTPVGISTQASILPWALYVRERGCSRKNNMKLRLPVHPTPSAGDSPRCRGISLLLLLAAGLPRATTAQYNNRNGDSVAADVADTG